MNTERFKDHVRRLALGETVADEDGLADALVDLGLEFAQSGDGITLTQPLELLDAAAVAGDVDDDLELFWSIGSTNTYLVERAPFAGPRFCLAERQESGKGRRGRTWVSPFGRNLYISVGFGFEGPMSALAGLSIVVGIEVVTVLRDAGVREAGLKWPNDILTPAGKLCGILVELGPAHRGVVPVVVGVGINVHGRVAPTSGIEQPWTSVAAYAEVSRNTLARDVVARLSRIARTFAAAGFAPWRDRWGDLCLHRGQQVTILRGSDTLVGQDAGIDEVGNLRLRTGGGDVLRIEAGEVSLRTTSPR